MHDTALETARLFFRNYVEDDGGPILEVGARDLNGCMRGCAATGSPYIGVDLIAGPGVDVVLEDPYRFPFADAHFSTVVSTSCFEHDSMFWVTFAEMARVTRPGGYIYVNAPSNGWIHRCPNDNWRFYPDSALALGQWAERQRVPVQVAESFIGRRDHTIWNDCVMVFCRGTEPRPRVRIADCVSGAMNIRRAGQLDELQNPRVETEDLALLRAVRERLAVRDLQIKQLRLEIESLELTLADCIAALDTDDAGSARQTAA